MILQANGKQKKAGVTILISDKADFKIKKTVRDKEKTEKTITESYQNEMAVRSTREEKQGTYRTTGKQEIRWQY